MWKVYTSFAFVLLFIFFGFLFLLSSLVFYVLPFGLLFILVWCFSGILDICGHYYFKSLLCPILSFFSCSSNNKYVLSFGIATVLKCSLLPISSHSILFPFQLGSYYSPNLSHLILLSTISSQVNNLIHSSFLFLFFKKEISHISFQSFEISSLF